MYIVKSNDNLVIIDPWESNELLEMISHHSLKIDYIILTHEHYDHISGVNWLKENFDCKVICNKECAEAIQHPNLNFSKYFDILIEVLPKETEMKKPIKVEPYSCSADITFEKQKAIDWRGHKIDLISTPGHSKGSICILLDNKFLFSGDSLLKDYPVITRLKGGSSIEYKEKTVPFFRSLKLEMTVFPGHYEKFILKESKYLY